VEGHFFFRDHRRHIWQDVGNPQKLIINVHVGVGDGHCTVGNLFNQAVEVAVYIQNLLVEVKRFQWDFKALAAVLFLGQH